ncbi:MAG: ribosome biogenesis GTPase Der [Pseudomonadales bacterium]|nr:ribosome biogenesis GTPase Der [Pseudomonadales bacterium]
MLPVIALVGRPNVGKSTLFNRITKTRDAIVANFSGLTRDRKYGEASHNDIPFMLIDTAGVVGDEQGVDKVMADQSMQAVDEADVVLLMVDGRAGLLPDDQWIIAQLRQRDKPFHLVVNKVDGVDINLVLSDFYSIGADKIFPITATHGKGVRQLLDFAITQLPEQPATAEDIAFAERANQGIKMAVVGRPNVGKSTLVNRMIGEERVVVYDLPGTTRDSIYIPYTREDKQYTLIDTAGVRRRKNVKQTVEKFSIVKTLQAIDDANVVILLIDAHEDLVEQDLHLLGLCIEAGRGLVIAINKWDGLDKDQKNHIRKELDRRLQFIDYAQVHFISALHGTGVGDLYRSIRKAYKSATASLSTRQLTTILEAAVEIHQPPMVAGRRIKLRYAHAGGSNPPIIVIHGNQTEKLPDAYKRYLEKTYRRELKLWGTPLRMEFRTSENPYADKPSKRKPQARQERQSGTERVQARQQKKRERLSAHKKKSNKRK